MIFFGFIIVIITFYLIAKGYENKVVLFLSGLAMSSLALNPAASIDAFGKALVNSVLVTTICSVLGFSEVMRVTGCDKHLVHMLSRALVKYKSILIPGAVMITFFINIALPSASGCVAAVGAILIPALTSAGVHPVIAGSALLAGSWGGVYNPGVVHNIVIAKLSGLDVMVVVMKMAKIPITGAIVSAIVLTIVARLRKEDCSMIETAATLQTVEQLKVNYLKAAVPVLPLVLLILGSPLVAVLPPISVLQAMVVSTIASFFVTWTKPEIISKEFFKGLGTSYGNVIGLIACATVFVEGMNSIGLTTSLVEGMKHSQYIAKLAASLGPFLMATLSGSSDSMILAFNNTITPHAEQLGFTIPQIGLMAFISGNIGRVLSPVAAATIIVAGMANVSALEMTKRNLPGMIFALIITMSMFLMGI
ncbi:C4-dicarboxylate transporter DcuC [Pelosinus sp. UFO1]|uniref:C4-dicarboxylate transporter DcuC n=1 Tax=Pelosinus sp. UFO1 TaxID=484770 RepID=UPI0004D10AFC|nr:C4-dicarboxylate transporter DcuC [Pelosinus sp. UFO1]AIF49722.1 C4-dicarboxylate anaerobic carrier-like protein [Pelosinus sp. UFO1]